VKEKPSSQATILSSKGGKKKKKKSVEQEKERNPQGRGNFIKRSGDKICDDQTAAAVTRKRTSRKAKEIRQQNPEATGKNKTFQSDQAPEN